MILLAIVVIKIDDHRQYTRELPTVGHVWVVAASSPFPTSPNPDVFIPRTVKYPGRSAANCKTIESAIIMIRTDTKY